MKIATWNVNGIRARQEQVCAWIAQDQPDVVCLQEIKASPHHIPPALAEMDGYWSYWHGNKGYSGVGILVRRDFCADCPQFVHPEFDMENRIVTAQIESVTVASIYVPNGGKDFPAKMRFLAAMEGYAEAARVRGGSLILCGDLNVARTDADVHPKERAQVIGQSPEERALFERILSRGLVDLGRALDPDNEAMYTWWAPWRQMRQRNIGWRLDYLLASLDLATKAVACPVLTTIGTSDHAPVMATFAP